MGSWWETGETRTTTISRRDTMVHQDMRVDKVDRDCLAVFGPRVASFSGHLWETTLRRQTKVHLDHRDMEMDKASCD